MAAPIAVSPAAPVALAQEAMAKKPAKHSAEHAAAVKKCTGDYNEAVKKAGDDYKAAVKDAKTKKGNRNTGEHPLIKS